MSLFALLLVTTSVHAVVDNEITSPEEGGFVFGNVHLEATYHDENEDNNDAVQWAVREGTCAAGTNTVAGNVDGFSSDYDWDSMMFSADVDTTGWDSGMYCFVFNPKEDAGDENIRLTREFYIVDGMVNGGGHILEMIPSPEEEELTTRGGKAKPEKPGKQDMYDISFGGNVAQVGSDYMGSWQINFHDVSNDDLDKAKFHGNEVDIINFFAADSDSCNSAVNFTMHGTLNGEEGYHVIVRGGDSGAPNDVDTVRIELYHGATLMYDTHAGDFADESTCVGTARTGLDNGNLTIQN